MDHRHPHPESLPFIFGAQYYRAPTPEPACWEYDHRRMKQLGFNHVKYWVQWRWAHRGEDRFHWDDLDRLMDLAAANDLAVTLNIICDVAPVWLYDKYPDAKQIMRNGSVIQPYANGCRQIGGTPGPCYNHPGALAERQKFVAAAIEHFRPYPALSMWDVWNEPEQSFPSRTLSDPGSLVCYCEHCRRGFQQWLTKKYGSIERLNEVWGRCYEQWNQVEMPRSRDSLQDFVDWREFHLDTMTAEAAWRLEYARRLDPRRVSYLHVVPSTTEAFSCVTCVDDFAIAEHCQVFAATMNGAPTWTTQMLGAARGRVAYNVESHMNHGSTSLHQRINGMNDLLRDFLPQIGLGIKGFLFWQYRPETLGVESPAWGLVRLDGGDRPITKAVAEFWAKLRPHVPAVFRSNPPRPQIGIWKSRKNEIFGYATCGRFQPLAESIDGHLQTLYWNNYAFRIVSGQMLEGDDLEDLKLLIMPGCYYVTAQEAKVLDQWVRRGGVLLNEAHLAAYSDCGRHSRIIPGCGLAESWGIREIDSTASHHLKLAAADMTTAGFDNLPEDVKKALKDFGTTGGQFFPIRLRVGGIAWGSDRYAMLEGEGWQREGTFDDAANCIMSREIGKGAVYYCGTNIGRGAKKDAAGLLALLRTAIQRAGLAPILGAQCAEPGAVRVDVLLDGGRPRFITIVNRTDREQELRLEAVAGTWRELISGEPWWLDGKPIKLPARFAGMLIGASGLTQP